MVFGVEGSFMAPLVVLRDSRIVGRARYFLVLLCQRSFLSLEHEDQVLIQCLCDSSSESKFDRIFATL